MKFRIKPSKLQGSVKIPGSKSHTIRGLVCGLLAKGESLLKYPLESSDTRSCLQMIRHFGAEIIEERDVWKIRGNGRDLCIAPDIIDVGNSGTTLYFGLGVASLIEGYTVFTGDHQIRNRPADPLLLALSELGCTALSTRNNGKPPLIVKGRMKGGKTSIEAHTSQYLSSLILAAPLSEEGVEIEVPLLNEAPYVDMTLSWVEKLGVNYVNEASKYFTVKGMQQYNTFTEPVPSDFSSAAFFLVAAALTGSTLELQGLDFNDSQGDKEVVSILEDMGAKIEIDGRSMNLEGRNLKGGEYDLNAIPDSLPALSVVSCFAKGETRLVNVPQARLKETDRIKVMFTELKRMGADVEELPDGLVVRESRLKGTQVHGHADHRVVMALAVAGFGAEGETTVDTAECASVTFPGFYKLMKQAGATIDIMEE